VQIACKHIITFTIWIQASMYRRMSSSFQGLVPVLSVVVYIPKCGWARCWNKHCKNILLQGRRIILKKDILVVSVRREWLIRKLQNVTTLKTKCEMEFAITLAASRNVTFRPLTPPSRQTQIRSVISRARIPSLSYPTLLGSIPLIQTHSVQQLLTTLIFGHQACWCSNTDIPARLH